MAALPLFLVGHGLARAARLGPERTVQIEEAAVALFNPLVVALTAVVLALAALALGVGPRWAVGGGLLGAFGTGLFVQMKDFNSEPLTALLFLGAVSMPAVPVPGITNVNSFCVPQHNCSRRRMSEKISNKYGSRWPTMGWPSAA